MTVEALGGQNCSAHLDHGPRNRTTEFHHVVPVAWQLKTHVEKPPFPGKDPDGRGPLWDARGVWLCPTGHRNVHFWIVSMMRALAKIGTGDPKTAYVAARPPGRAPAEFPVAYEALARFDDETAVGLLGLTAIGEWGQW